MGDLVGAIRRRWWLAIACLLLVAAGSIFRVLGSSPNYSFTSTYLLLPPEVSRVTDPSVPDYSHGNPLFFLSSLDQARDILIGSMTSSTTEREVARKYPGVSYTVTPDILGSGPVLVVTTQSTSKQAAADAASGLTRAVPTRLSELQSQLGVEKSAMITTTPITRDTEPSVSHKQQVRSGITVFGALTVASLFLIGVVDALLMSRSALRRSSGDNEPTPSRRPRAESRTRRGEGVGDGVGEASSSGPRSGPAEVRTATPPGGPRKAPSSTPRRGPDSQ